MKKVLDGYRLINEGLTEQNEQLENRVTTLENTVHHLKEELDKKDHQISDLFTRLNKKDEQIERLFEGFKELKKENQELKRDNEKLGKRVVQLEEASYKRTDRDNLVEELAEENTKLKIECKTANEIADDLSKKLTLVGTVMKKHFDQRDGSPTYTKLIEEVRKTPVLHELLKD